MSPHYPDNYDRDSDCEWIIQVDHTHSIELSILDFDLEYHDACNHDYVKVRYGFLNIGQLKILHYNNENKNQLCLSA